MKRLLYAVLVLCLSLTFVGCGGSEPQSSESQPINNGEETGDSSALIDEMNWTFEGKSKYSDGVLYCPKGSAAVCNDENLPTSYYIECDITASRINTSGLAINDVKQDGHYILGINSTTDKIQLNKYIGDSISTVANFPFETEPGEFCHIKLYVTNAYARLYVSKSGEELPQYQSIDVKIEKFRPNTLSVTAPDCDISLKNIKIRSNDMKLSVNERFLNPIATGADPYVLYHDGTYYLYSTNAVNEGYKVFTSTNLSTWEDRGLCLREKDVYGAHTSSGGFWAPEVYHYNGKFYMIYTVDEHLGVAVADSPLGPFVSPKQSYINNDKREIDGHLFFDDDGKVYIYFVRCSSSVGPGKGNEIFGAEFDMETFTYKNEKCLLYPSANTWEWVGNYGYVAEGPAMLKHEGRYYLTYSANGYTSQDYAVGLAISDSPLGTYNKYEGNPILKKSKTNGVYGPGHHCFTYSPDGKELFIVYHRHNSATTIHTRVTCIDRAYFVLDEKLGYDVLKVVGPTVSPQPLPSGMIK